jgi:hypothetical protein
MSSDAAPDVSALAINVTIPEGLRWTDTRRGGEFTLIGPESAQLDHRPDAGIQDVSSRFVDHHLADPGGHGRPATMMARDSGGVRIKANVVTWPRPTAVRPSAVTGTASMNASSEL